MIYSRALLRWVYLGRLTLSGGLFGGALLVWRVTSPQTTLLATLGLLASLTFSLASFWYTDVLLRRPGRNFFYAQSIFDTLLVTLAVHMTMSPDGGSDFAPLYILVIAAGALLLPLPGGMLIGALASILYFADMVWFQPESATRTVILQIGLFAAVALVTGYLGDRLRQTGTALGAAESELRQLRLETSDILDAIDAGVVTADSAGRLVYLNRAAELLLGIKGREWSGRPVVEELERRAPGVGASMERAVQDGVPVGWLETQAANAPGRVLGLRTTVLERDGTPWVTAVVQDVTANKRIEELHRRADRLQAVAALSASLAHEIKNPLASIRSAVEQLTGRELENVDRDVLQRLVVRESERLSRLLSEFIEYSRVEVRRTSRLNLAALTSEAIALVKQHPDALQTVRIGYDQPAEPVLIEGDEDLLHRAVFNLVLNAVQHAGPTGEVGVRVERIADEALPYGVRLRAPVCLAVRDSGPGMTAETAAQIFDPFFSTRKGGTGLGLALVHRAVEAHRGAIIVDPGAGNGAGAQFSVYLPGAA